MEEELNDKDQVRYIHLPALDRLFRLRRSGKLSATGFETGVVVATFMNAGGKCWPKVETIAARSGRSRRSIFRGLGELRRLGILKDSADGAYELAADPSDPLAPAKVDTDKTDLAEADSDKIGTPGAKSGTEPVTELALKGDRIGTEPVTELALKGDKSGTPITKEVTKEVIEGIYEVIMPRRASRARPAKTHPVNPHPANPQPAKTHAAKTQAPNPEIKIFIDWYAEEHQRIVGAKLVVTGGKDAANVKRVLGQLDLEELKRRAKRFLHDPKSWPPGDKGITALCQSLNRYTVPDLRGGDDYEAYR